MKAISINKNLIKGEIILIFAAVLWGSCFIFQKKGMDYIGPFTLGVFRFLIGGLTLIPIMFISRKKNNENIPKSDVKVQNKHLIIGGTICGTAMFFAASLQQIGLIYTTSGKAGFITSMEMIVVAVITIFITRKILLNVVFGISTAIIGMYMLCINNGISFQFGDSIVLISCIFWGAQILFVDKYSKMVDNIKLSFIEFIVCGILSGIFMIIFEKPEINNIISCTIPILYTAIIEVGICYTLQTIGQKYVPPVIAAVTLTLESVFSVIFGVIFLGEYLSGKEVGGCIFMLISVIIVQIPIKIKFVDKIFKSN